MTRKNKIKKKFYFGAPSVYIPKPFKVLKCKQLSPACVMKYSYGYKKTHIKQKMCIPCMRYLDIYKDYEIIPTDDDK